MISLEQFFDDLQKTYPTIATENLTEEDRITIKNVYDNVVEFLKANNLVPADKITALESVSTIINTFNPEVGLENIGVDAVYDLCRRCMIPESKLYEAAREVAACLYKYSNGNPINEHFGTVDKSKVIANAESKSVLSLLSPAVASDVYMSPDKALAIAKEAFGKDIDTTMVDAKLALTVTLLKFHRSVINRLLPTIAVNENLIMIKVENLELYDLQKAMSSSAEERYKGSHRIPFVDLYRDPSPANITPKRIVPLQANDSKNNYLVADGIIKFNVEANLFDLARVAGVFGYDKTDYTDLVSDGGKIKNIIIKVSDGTNEELIPIPVEFFAGARFIPNMNTGDSADRIATINNYGILTKNTVKLDGTTTSILSFLTDDNYIRVNLTVNAMLNLKTSYIKATGSISTDLLSKVYSSYNDIPDTIKTAYESLTFELVGYEPEVYYNEENLRKTTSAVRVMTKALAYEIPGSKNVVVDFSLAQESPEVVINALNKYLSVGYDDRAIKIILDTLDRIYEWLQLVNNYPIYENYEKSIINEFAAGHIVKPFVYKTQIKILPNVNNMKTSELWSDIRALAEKYIMDIIVRIHNESFYDKELDPGEKPTYNVLTSGYVLDALFALPSINEDAKNNSQKEPNDVVEFRRILPNGVVLNFFTTTFEYMTNKLLLIPVRPNVPESVLNFATNYDRGTFVAQINAYIEGSAFRRVVANQRQFPIITCPIGVVLEIQDLSELFPDGLTYIS